MQIEYTFDKIKERAKLLHDVEVNQKYDIHPYSYHLFSVANLAEEYMKSYYGFMPGSEVYNTLFFAACFHDSIEDARKTYNDIKNIAIEFENVNPIMAAELVYALTAEKGKTRAERENENYYKGIRETPFAGFLKLCDRYANMLYSKETGSSKFKMYKEELPEFLKHLHKLVLPDILLDKIREL